MFNFWTEFKKAYYRHTVSEKRSPVTPTIAVPMSDPYGYRNPRRVNNNEIQPKVITQSNLRPNGLRVPIGVHSIFVLIIVFLMMFLVLSVGIMKVMNLEQTLQETHLSAITSGNWSIEDILTVGLYVGFAILAFAWQKPIKWLYILVVFAIRIVPRVVVGIFSINWKVMFLVVFTFILLLWMWIEVAGMMF